MGALGTKEEEVPGRPFVPIVRSFGRTDVGRHRKENEDAFFRDDALRLYVVADGLGGHAAGEAARRVSRQVRARQPDQARPVSARNESAQNDVRCAR